MEHRTEFQDPSSLIELAKQACDITKSPDEMSINDIQTVVKWIGAQAPDTVWADGKPVFGKIGISLMLSVTLQEFPEFYEQNELSQFN